MARIKIFNHRVTLSNGRVYCKDKKFKQFIKDNMETFKKGVSRGDRNRDLKIAENIISHFEGRIL